MGKDLAMLNFSMAWRQMAELTLIFVSGVVSRSYENASECVSPGNEPGNRRGLGRDYAAHSWRLGLLLVLEQSLQEGWYIAVQHRCRMLVS